MSSVKVLPHVGLSWCRRSRAPLCVKDVAGRINDVIHAPAILIALPRILNPNVEVSKLSLASGNTGRSYDLETNRRSAEFKLIRWRGGAEAGRQDGLFKDVQRRKTQSFCIGKADEKALTASQGLAGSKF